MSDVVTKKKAWAKLHEHYALVKDKTISDYFAEEPDRGTRYRIEVGDLYLDYSKNMIDDEAFSLFQELLQETQVRAHIDAMFSGKKINVSEKREVLHTALRNISGDLILTNGTDVMVDIKSTLSDMKDFTQKIKDGVWTGGTGKKITHIVNIGIGGSYLGPLLASEALDYYKGSITVDFLANIDPSDFHKISEQYDPESTLFVVESKFFTTKETLENAFLAKKWIIDSVGKNHVQNHFIAVTANRDEALSFGISDNGIFPMWDWVGGRYSLTSAIGLPVMLQIGAEKFEEMLHGFHLMDKHFHNAPFEKNMPVILAVLGIWYNNFYESQSYTVLPYSEQLSSFPSYLQQLDMESNGKSITKDGEKVYYQTGPLVWGGSGTKAQHSFFQLLHQGTKLVPCDFIGYCKSLYEPQENHDILLSNMLAQSEALAFGRSKNELEMIPEHERVYRSFSGNKPSNTILATKLTPSSLGQIIALYEHKIFVQGIIWGINSFDQWGVELGKKLANKILPELQKDSDLVHDSSTNELIKRYRNMR